MKFILKKDLPGIKAGTIYDSEDKVRLSKEASSINHAVMLFGTDNDFFEEVKEKVKVWKPEYGDKLWFIYSTGDISMDKWIGDTGDEMRLSYGNVYKTEEEATKARDKQLAIVRCRNYLIENDLLEEDMSKEYYIVYEQGDIYCSVWRNASHYSPYGRIKVTNIAKFLEDCKEDLLLIHSV